MGQKIEVNKRKRNRVFLFSERKYITVNIALHHQN